MNQNLPRRVHIMGIGGAHMSAIAQILHHRGQLVSGCDLRPSAVTRQLEQMGMAVAMGHSPEHIADSDLVVATVAVSPDNPELQAARERGLSVLSRAEMVAQLMEERYAICVAGSHGKSTTTALIAYMLRQARLDPTFLVGAEMVDLGTNATAGGGPHIVVEADEYAAAFLHYRPQLALVTNIEPDHLDYYGSYPHLVAAFRQFLSQVPDDGTIVVGGDDPTLCQLAEEAWAPQVVRYSLASEAEWRAEEIKATEGGQTFVATYRGQPYASFCTPLPGRYNVSNCLGGIAAGFVLGLPANAMQAAVAKFHGVARRFQKVGHAADIIVMDDYAHHPTEIKATLATARQYFPGRRLVCLFQPHTYSRTQYLLEGFRTCFQEADVILIADTYAAREEPSAGMSAQGLTAAIVQPLGKYVGDLTSAAEAALAELHPGDVFFTIGAGDVDQVGPMVLEGLRRR